MVLCAKRPQGYQQEQSFSVEAKLVQTCTTLWGSKMEKKPTNYSKTKPSLTEWFFLNSKILIKVLKKTGQFFPSADTSKGGSAFSKVSKE